MCRANLNFKMSYWQCQQFCARHERFSSRDTTASYEESNRLWSCGLLPLFFNHTFFTTPLSTSVSPQVIGLKSSQHLLALPNMQSVWHCLFWRTKNWCLGAYGWPRKGLDSQRSHFITAKLSIAFTRAGFNWREWLWAWHKLITSCPLVEYGWKVQYFRYLVLTSCSSKAII